MSDDPSVPAIDPKTKTIEQLEAEWLEETLARAPLLDDETVYQIVRLLRDP